MRVAIDGTPLTVSTGGVRRYVEQLHAALTVCFPENRYALVSDQLGTPPSALDRRWWLIGLRREMSRLGADLFHGTDFAVPYWPARPSVMTLHDLSPWRAETRLDTSARVRRRTPLLLRLGLAAMVITPSAAVRREAIARFGLAPERVVPIPLAAHGLFRPVAVPPPGRRYLLYVGTVEKRKNLTVAAEAWRELRKSADVDFAIAGRVLDATGLDGARLLGPVPEADLPALYAGALAVVYPSLYEGFGLPVLEAMQCGAMVITSLDPAITEVAHGAAVQVDARDARGWFEALQSALSADNRASWRERGLLRAQEFSWERTARLTQEVYLEAVRRG